MSVRGWFWNRCWLGCGWYKSRDEPLQRNSTFLLLNLSCRERERESPVAFPPLEAYKSKQLNKEQPRNAVYPAWVRLVGTLLPLPMGNTRASMENSVQQAVFLMSKRFEAIRKECRQQDGKVWFVSYEDSEKTFCGRWARLIKILWKFWRHVSQASKKY